MLAAVRRFPRWKPERVAFSTWVKGVARERAHYIRQHGLRAKRARVTVGQFAGDDFDTFAATADPKARDPAELVAAALDPRTVLIPVWSVGADSAAVLDRRTGAARGPGRGARGRHRRDGVRPRGDPG